MIAHQQALFRIHAEWTELQQLLGGVAHSHFQELFSTISLHPPTAINSGAVKSKILVVGAYDPQLESGFLLQVGVNKDTIDEACSTVSFPGSSNQSADGVNATSKQSFKVE